MILECPACSARYRIADGAIPPEGKAVRCAKCGHRWQQAFAAGPPPALAPAPPGPVAPPAEPVPVPDETAPDVAPRRVHWGWTLLTVVVGLALTAAAALVQNPGLPPLDLTRVPVVGDWLDRRVNPPAPPPVTLTLAGSATFHDLRTGGQLVALSGTIVNPTSQTVAVPPVEALVIDTARHAVYRWRIAAPVAVLGPGRSAAFESSASGFPASGVKVTLRFDAAR